ncbi:MAG: NADH-quinone oxidoreductase subunit N [Bacteroidales bacterium]|nr:NADH-quinone oxidoreductase subunit N [Bacteroidales bacterium]
MATLIALSVLAIITMLIGAWHKYKWIVPVLVTGMAVALALNINDWNTYRHYYNEMMFVDNYAVAFNTILIVMAMLVVLIAGHYFRNVVKPLDDVYILMIFSLIGGTLMTSFSNLSMLFIGIETLSISMYVLAGSKKFDNLAKEASMKYFLMGSFASGFLLFGIALLYGSAGSFNLEAIGLYATSHANDLPKMFYAGMLLTLIGLVFKVAAVPFHFWVPDVYQGAPTVITSFMATVVKVAGVAAIFRLFNHSFMAIQPFWSTTVVILSAATIILANVTALYQRTFKRLLAYSGIAHTGYLLMALVASNATSMGAVLLYLAAYSLSTYAAFVVLMLVKDFIYDDKMEHYQGLARRNPLIAITLAISMLSLTGIPPLAGFMGKFALFSSTLESGHLYLVIIAILGSAISLAFYLKPVISMFFKEGGQIVIGLNPWLKVFLVLLCLAQFALGLIPGMITQLL